MTAADADSPVGRKRPAPLDRPLSHEAYFAAQSAGVRPLLEAIQREVERQVPVAVRTISYNMPAFKITKSFFYFAAFKKHIGVYPPVTGDAALMLETQAYRGPKGNLMFPYAQELPIALIGRVAVALHAQYSSDS